MFSDNVHFWNDRQMLLKPAFPWELVQIGNCGSPIETDAGWLVLSHGVGPLRKYCIGAFLLIVMTRQSDRPSPGTFARARMKTNGKVRAQRCLYLRRIVHQGKLIIPYALADHAPVSPPLRWPSTVGNEPDDTP